MKADDLRASILQAAIQGKLTKQDFNDEPASVLIERIRDEKHRLVREGKIKKDKNESFIFKRDNSWFETINGKDERCIDDEIPFEIPNNWVWSRLDSICDQIIDCPHSTPHYIESETGFYAIDTNCFDRSGKITSYRNLSKNDYETRVSKLIPSGGDVVYSREGVVGYAAILPNDRKICLGQRVMLFRPSQFIYSEWIRAIVSHSFFIDVLLSMSKGIGVKHVNVGDVKLLLIPIPPINEQSTIISVLNKSCSLIDDFSHYEHKTTVLDSDLSSRLTMSILQYAFWGKLTRQDPNDEPSSVLIERIRDEKHSLIKEGKIKKDKNESFIFKRDGSWFETINGKNERCIDDDVPFEIPESWIYVRLRSLGSIVGGSTPNTSDNTLWGGDIPWITPADMRNSGNYISGGSRSLTTKGLESCSTVLLPTGSIVYSSRAPIGYVSITKRPLCTNQGCKSLIPYGLINPMYVLYCLTYNTPKIIDNASGTTFKEISGSDFGNIIIPLPPFKEQTRMVEIIDKLLLQCNILRCLHD